MQQHYFFGLLVFLALQAQAQQRFTSCQQYIDFALLNNTQLRQSFLNEKVEEQNRNSSIAAVLPVVRSQTTLTDNLILNTQLIPQDIFPGGQPGTYKEVQFGTKYLLNPGFDASFNLINAANYQNLKVAKEQMELSRLNTLSNKEQLEFTLAQLYYLNILYKKNMIFAKSNQQNADSLLYIITVRFDNQFADEIELNRAKTNSLHAKINAEQAWLMYEKNKNEMLLLAGLKPEVDIVINDESLQTVEVNDKLQIGNTTRVGELIAQQKLQIARQQLKREQLRLLPELTAFGNFFWQGQNNDFKFASSEQKWFKNSAIGLRLDVPLFNGGQKFYQIQKAKLNTQVAQLEWEYTQSKMKKENEELTIDYFKYGRELTSRKEQLIMAERNYELALVKYKSQSISYDGVVTISNELISAQQQLLQTTANYISTRYKITSIKQNR